MADEAKFRSLLEQAQESATRIEPFLDAISDAPAAEAPEIKRLVADARQKLHEMQEGIDRLWDVFKRQQ